MRIGLLDVDSHNYPNLALMKLSAYHKKHGDSVEWYQSFTGHYDKVYVSKVFSFTPDIDYAIDADEVIYGGTGYAISSTGGGECYDPKKDSPLPYEIEHQYPDYSLYGITDTAYGFLTRGCPRGCSFCVVKAKEGSSHKVADLSEFWNGQKNIILCDPNILASPESTDLLNQLVESKARVEFNQGLDIRLMTEEKAELLKQINCSYLHFAWDRYADGETIVPKLKLFKEITGYGKHKATVYCLCNYDTTFEQDLERIYTIRDEVGFCPYVMLYQKYNLKHGDPYFKLARWCNNKRILYTVKDFKDYKR